MKTVDRAFGDSPYQNHDENPGTRIETTCICCEQPLIERVQPALMPGKPPYRDWMCINPNCQLYKFSADARTYAVDASSYLASLR